MAYFLKVLSDMLQSPQPLSHIHICPKPKIKLGSTETLYLTSPSSLDIATTRNPKSIRSHRWDLGLTEMGLQTLYCMLQLFRSHRDKQSVPTSLLDQLSVLPITKIGLTEFV